jgi:hypothetical protein
MGQLLGAAAAGALVVRAVADQLAGAGRQAEERVEEQADEDAELREWHMAAAEAVGLNASIRALTERAAGVPGMVELPRRLDLDYRPLGEVRAWVAATASRVEAARAALASATAAADWAKALASVPAARRTDTSVTEALARYREQLQTQRAVDYSPGAEEIVGRLDPDAADDDREAVLRQAALLAAANHENAGMYRSALLRRVQKANSRAGDRLRAARCLEALERPEVVADAPELAATARSLQEVVAGTATLTPELAAETRRAVEHAVSVTGARYRRELLTELLTARGFTVTGDPAGHLRLARDGWQGEDAAEVWLDAGLDVHFRLLSGSSAVGDDAELRTAERYARLREHLTGVAHEMSHRGVAGVVLRPHQTQHTGVPGVENDGVVSAPARKERGRSVR